MNDLFDRLTAALSERYELERELGRGGMAVVYLVQDLKQGRHVALKVFQPDVAAAMGPKRFQREVEIATHLEHPHILSLYDSGEAEGLLYYVMPYVEEESLRQRLDREGQLPIEDALRIAREMAEALDYAHEQGVVHRDVKPGNVLLQRGHALLADFGVARALEASGAEKLTGTGVSVGTPQYMAPEQVTGADTVDGRADVYAVGAVLYEMLTGEPPYTGSTPQAVLAKRMAGPPTPVPVLRETVSPDVDGIVQQAMARSRADRWQSAGALAKALAVAERGGGTPIPGLATRPGVTAEVTAVGAKPKRRAWNWAVVGVVAAAAIAAALFGAGYLDFLRPAPQTDPFLVAVIPARTGTDRVAARAIGNAIDGWADLRQVPPSRLLARLDEEATATLGPDEAGGLAGEMGAGRFVLVRAEELGPNLNVGAELWEAADSLVRVTALDTTGSYAEFAEDWYLDVVLRLFRDQSVGAAPALRRAEWIADPRAMYPYYEALAWIERSNSDSTVAYLQAAVAIDSTFGEAWSRLEYAAWASAYRAAHADDSTAFRSYALIRDTAASFVSRFYTPEVSVAGLVQASLEAETFPDSAEVQFETGRLYETASLPLGFDSDSARPYLERALELDPDQEPGPLFYLHLFHNRLDEAWRLAERFAGALSATPYTPMHVDMLAILHAPDLAVRDSLLVVYENRYPGLGRQATWRSLQWQDSITVSRYMAEFLVPDTSPEYSLAMPLVELAAGRGSAVASVVDGLDPRWCQRDSESYDGNRCWSYKSTMLYRASMNIPGALGEPEPVVRDLYSWIRDHFSDSRRGWVGQMVKLWYLGMLDVRLGDLVAASVWADSMSQLAADSIPDDPSSSEVRFASDLPAEVRAAVAVERGDDDAALTILEDIEPSGDSPEGGAYITRRRPYTRLARGEILLKKGRYEEADGWFATFPVFDPPDEEFAFLAPALRGRALAHDALGRHEEALHYYRRFVTRWQDADPHLQPQVEEARQRIRELEAELN